MRNDPPGYRVSVVFMDKRAVWDRWEAEWSTHRRVYSPRGRFRFRDKDVMTLVLERTSGQKEFTTLAGLERLRTARAIAISYIAQLFDRNVAQLAIAIDVGGLRDAADCFDTDATEARKMLKTAQVVDALHPVRGEVERVLRDLPGRNPLIYGMEIRALRRMHQACGQSLETTRDQLVWDLREDGVTYREIGEALEVAPSTARSLLRRIEQDRENMESMPQAAGLLHVPADRWR